MGVANAKHEIFLLPRSMLATKFHNIVTYTDLPRGGHFLALEEPQLLAEEIWKFVGQVEMTKGEEDSNCRTEL